MNIWRSARVLAPMSTHAPRVSTARILELRPTGLAPLAEDIADDLIDAREALRSLRVIVEGRTTPPTDAELLAHATAHPTGGWAVSRPDDDTSEGMLTGEPWGDIARWHRKGGYRWRWIALDGEGRPCAWQAEVCS